jgi:membrane protein DedA with SNARE-associated domain
MTEALFHWVSAYGAAALSLLLCLGVFGLPIPDETLLTFAGVLVRQGRLHFATTWGAAAVGSMCGITLSYAIGRGLGPTAVARFGRWLHVNANDLARVERWLERSGKWMLTFGYFVPGVRHLTAIVAGSSQLPVRVFATYAYSGAALWSLSFITLGWWVGRHWESALHAVQRHILIAALALAAAAALYGLVHFRQRRRRSS